MNKNEKYQMIIIAGETCIVKVFPSGGMEIVKILK